MNSSWSIRVVRVPLEATRFAHLDTVILLAKPKLSSRTPSAPREGDPGPSRRASARRMTGPRESLAPRTRRRAGSRLLLSLACTRVRGRDDNKRCVHTLPSRGSWALHVESNQTHHALNFSIEKPAADCLRLRRILPEVSLMPMVGTVEFSSGPGGFSYRAARRRGRSADDHAS